MEAFEDFVRGLVAAGPVAAVAFVLLYLVPTGLAVYRRHPQAPAIFFLNLLLGWTTLGWVAALVWSATAAQRSGDAPRAAVTARSRRPGGG